MSTSPRIVISGHFNGFTDAHLDYFKQAKGLGGYITCIVSSDKQLALKKKRGSMSAESRAEIVNLILKGLNVQHQVVINNYDEKTTLIANVLKLLKPDILFRGGDKDLETMPRAERQICERLGIKILHAEYRMNTHGSNL